MIYINSNKTSVVELVNQQQSTVLMTSQNRPVPVPREQSSALAPRSPCEEAVVCDEVSPHLLMLLIFIGIIGFIDL